jgi:hypothetical protein
MVPRVLVPENYAEQAKQIIEEIRQSALDATDDNEQEQQ